MIRREQLRLNRLFQRLLLVSLAAPAGVYACSSSDNPASGPEDGGGAADATAGVDAQTSGSDSGMGTDGGGAVDGSGPTDAGPDTYMNPACDPGPWYHSDAGWVPGPDSGPDAAANPDRECYYFRDFPCGTTYTTGGCYLYLTNCHDVCSPEAGFVDCRYWDNEGCSDASVVAEAGQPITIACGLCSGVGRRPKWLDEPFFSPASSALGDYLARAAHLEAASVEAFLVLREELCELGAPAPLIDMAARSARDEIRHARVTETLARRRGGVPVKARVRRRRPRSLEAIARENAVEGCVRETFGAMVATWQAANARDPEIRTAMRRIATDETRHAALAWAVAQWADERLDAAARQRIRRAQRAAVRKLARDVAQAAPAELQHDAGLPAPARARDLVRAMEQALWT